MIGAKYVYEIIRERLGARAGVWLDSPVTHPQVDAETPREALESGCPACIDGVYQLAVNL